MKRALIHGTRICEVREDGDEFPVHESMEWVDVADNTVPDQDTYLNGAVVKYVPPATTANDVRLEAERRIDAGKVLASGVRFKCDTNSINRLDGMLQSTKWPKRFKTQGGVDVTLNSQLEAKIIFDECDDYITDVLATSADLQDSPPADPSDDQHWPSDGG